MHSSFIEIFKNRIPKTRTKAWRQQRWILTAVDREHWIPFKAAFRIKILLSHDWFRIQKGRRATTIHGAHPSGTCNNARYNNITALSVAFIFLVFVRCFFFLLFFYCLICYFVDKYVVLLRRLIPVLVDICVNDM